MRRKRCTNNNKGATLVFSVITILVIGVLAALILSMAVSNFKIKSLDYKTKQNFYSAEVAANEIYSGIGSYAIDFLGQAYSFALSSMAEGNPAADDQKYILYSSATELNKTFRQEYMSRMIAYLIDGDAATIKEKIKGLMDHQNDADKTLYNNLVTDFDTLINASGNLDKVMTKVQRCVSGFGTTTKLEFLPQPAGESPMYFDVEKFQFVVNDLKITYNKGPEVSIETFDLAIKFPNWNMSYIQAGDLGNPYLHYSMIGETGLRFEGVSATTINGGLFGGGVPKSGVMASTNGIQIYNSAVTVNTITTPSAVEGVGAVCTNGDILIQSTPSKPSSLHVTAGKVWANNIVVPSGSAFVSAVQQTNITMDAASSVFLSDDLEINGDKNVTSINGDFYGYGMNMEDNGDPAGSSAIIVNGSSVKVTLNPANKLYLAGRAYISIAPSAAADNRVTYVTGESVALKSNEQAYLVPSQWMKNSLSNPLKASVYNASPVSSNISNAVDLAAVCSSDIGGFLDPVNPVVTKRAKSGEYYNYFYFNFKDFDAATQFITYVSNYGGGSDAIKSLKSSIQDNYRGVIAADGTFTSGISLGGNASTSGAVSTANASSVSIAGSYNKSDISSVTYKNIYNRFALMQHLLVDVPQTLDEMVVYDYRKVNGKNYDMTAFSFLPVTNYVDREMLSKPAYNNLNDNSIVVPGVDGVTFHVIYKDGDVEYDSSMASSNPTVIVATGDVILSRPLNGLVMAFGNVIVEDGGSQFNARPDLIDKLLQDGKSGGNRVGEVFKFYQTHDSSSENVDRIEFSDVIEYVNWRKY